MRVGADLLGAAFFVALGAALAVAGRELGVGQVTEPGSGFLVFWCGLLICGFALWTGAEALRDGGPSVPSLWAGTRWGKVALVVGALLLYAVALDLFGFLPATVPLLLFLLRAVDPVRWRVALPVAIGATVLSWWVVERLLLVQLPKGTLELF